MPWTKKKPTKEGWYWCRCKGCLSGRTYTTMVKVNPNLDLVFWDGENFDINSDSFVEWGSEPIEEEKE